MKKQKGSAVAYVKSCCAVCVNNVGCSSYRRLMDKDPIMYQRGHLMSMANCRRWNQAESGKLNGCLS